MRIDAYASWRDSYANGRLGVTMPRPLSDWTVRIRQFFDEGDSNECWPWKGKPTEGYGTFRMGGASVSSRRAHHAVYIALVGPIPPGKRWHVDHLCRNTICVNPAHLELVDTAVNTLRGEAPSAKNARKTHCPRGHEYDVVYTSNGRKMRACRTCRREYPSARWGPKQAEAQRARRARQTAP